MKKKEMKKSIPEELKCKYETQDCQNFLENHQVMLHKKLTSLTRSDKGNARGDKESLSSL